MRVCLMVEGQEDVSWEQWLALAHACEVAGLEGLFRSDHYLSVQGHPERGALDAWATLAALAQGTERIRLGTLVSPATFRHPSLLAKMVVTVDYVSGGRAELGLGAGWHEPEHRAYGFPFPPQGTRLEMLEEQVEIVRRSWQPGPFDFAGRHYRIEGLDARPKPLRPHPNLIIGGSGGPRSAAVAARWADEYNTVFSTPDECRTVHRGVAEAWEKGGRDPATLVFSLMTGALVGRDPEEFERRKHSALAGRGEPGSDDEAWLAENAPKWITGTIDQAVARLQEYEAAGVQRVMLQLQQNDDVDMVHVLGEIAALVAL